MAQLFRRIFWIPGRGFCSRHAWPALPCGLCSAHLPGLLVTLSALLPHNRKYSWAIYNSPFSDPSCLVPKWFVGSSPEAPSVLSLVAKPLELLPCWLFMRQGYFLGRSQRAVLNVDCLKQSCGLLPTFSSCSWFGFPSSWTIMGENDRRTWPWIEEKEKDNCRFWWEK